MPRLAMRVDRVVGSAGRAVVQQAGGADASVERRRRPGRCAEQRLGHRGAADVAGAEEQDVDGGGS